MSIPIFRLAIENISNREHYSVYVIELSKDVLDEKKFRDANPDYDKNKKCVYVGMTGLDPKERFQKHKNGEKSNKYAKEYGVRLLPELSDGYNNLSFDNAKEKEVELAEKLRNQGYAVYQA